VYAITVDDAGRHLLEQRILLKVNRHPGPHVGYVLREQGMHQTHEFASREHEGTFVLVLGDFVVLAPVVSFVLQVEATELVCALDEVVAGVDVTDFGHASVLGDEVAGRAPLPGQADILGQVLVFREARDVDDLGQDACGDDGSQAFDGDDRVGNGVAVASDELIQMLHRPVDEANVVPTDGQGSGDHLVHLRVDGVGGAQCLPNRPGCGGRIVKAPVAAMGDQVSVDPNFESNFSFR